MSQLSGDAPPSLSLRRTNESLTTRRWSAITTAHLLVVDPDNSHHAVFNAAMARHGVTVTWVGSTSEGLVEFGRIDPTVILLALDAGRVPVVEFTTTVLKYGSPLVVAALTPDTVADAGTMLLAGAQAAVAKPYTADQVWERIGGVVDTAAGHTQVAFGPIKLDARAYTVHLNGERSKDLPLKEFELLHRLLASAPDVVTNDELGRALWGDGQVAPTTNNLAVHVARLRRRLQAVAKIRRVRGQGYALTLDAP